jgi:hypothetical protein
MEHKKEIWNTEDVCQYFDIHEQTLKTWIAAARAGEGDFILPIGPKGSKRRWRRVDIENYQSTIGNERVTPKASTAQQKARQAKVMQELQSLLSKNKKGGTQS